MHPTLWPSFGSGCLASREAILSGRACKLFDSTWMDPPHSFKHSHLAEGSYKHLRPSFGALPSPHHAGRGNSACSALGSQSSSQHISKTWYLRSPRKPKGPSRMNSKGKPSKLKAVEHHSETLALICACSRSTTEPVVVIGFGLTRGSQDQRSSVAFPRWGQGGAIY